MKRAYADIPEGQIHYRIEGDGEPILLLHMAVASSDEFSRAMHYLSKYYRAIALDLCRSLNSTVSSKTDLPAWFSEGMDLKRSQVHS